MKHTSKSNIKNLISDLNNGNTKVSSKTAVFCCYCGYHFLKKQTVKCSKPKCMNIVCYNCAITINDKPFCPECMIKLMREDTLVILTKRKI